MRDCDNHIVVGDICILPPRPLSSGPSTQKPSPSHRPTLLDPSLTPLPSTPPSSDENELVCWRAPPSSVGYRSTSEADRFVPVASPTLEPHSKRHVLRRRSVPEPRPMTDSHRLHTQGGPCDVDIVRRPCPHPPTMVPLASSNPSNTGPTRRSRNISWSGVKRTLSLGSSTSTTGINSPTSSVSGPDATASRLTSISAEATSAVIAGATPRAHQHRRSSSFSLGLRQRLSALTATGAGDTKDASGGGVGRTLSGRERAGYLRITVPRASEFRDSQHRHRQHHQRVHHGGTRGDFVDGPSDCTDDNTDEFLIMRGPGSIAGQSGSSSSSLMAPPSSSLPPHLDDHIRALNFPAPPPGRIVSVTGFGDMMGALMGPGSENVGEMDKVWSDASAFDATFPDLPVAEAMGIERDRQGKVVVGSDFTPESDPSISALIATPSSASRRSSTALDCSPTIPALDPQIDPLPPLPPPHTADATAKDVTTCSTRTNAYCPPSPSLTPSPNLSLRADSLLLTTPDSVNQREPERRDCSPVPGDKTLLPRLGPLAGGDDADDPRPTVTTVATTTTATSPISPSSSSCTTVTTIGDQLHTYTTQRTPLTRAEAVAGGVTMSVVWSRDSGMWRFIKPYSLYCSSRTITSWPPLHPSITCSPTSLSSIDCRESRRTCSLAYCIATYPSPPNAHPLHHKPAPSVPHSTRTSYVSSTNHPDPSTYSSPPTTLTQLSRRYSKYTAFSGSSASSIASSDSASVRHGTPHWGLGEKPDIATVFEEDGEFDALGRSVKGDSTAETKVISEPGPFHQPGQRQPSPSKAGGLKDLDSRVPEFREHVHHTHHHHHQQQLSTSTSDSNFVGHSDSRSHTSHSTFPHAVAKRISRSGTITSDLSSRSHRTTKSPHPFATMARTASPPMRSFREEGSGSGLASSQSMPNMLAYTSPVDGPSCVLPEVVIAEPDMVDDDVCPVCNVSLSSEFRVRGEKPLVVAECGHEVHYVSCRDRTIYRDLTSRTALFSAMATTLGPTRIGPTACAASADSP